MKYIYIYCIYIYIYIQGVPRVLSNILRDERKSHYQSIFLNKYIPFEIWFRSKMTFKMPFWLTLLAVLSPTDGGTGRVEEVPVRQFVITVYWFQRIATLCI